MREILSMIWFTSKFRVFCSFKLGSEPLHLLLTFSGTNLVFQDPEPYFRGCCKYSCGD